MPSVHDDDARARLERLETRDLCALASASLRARGAINDPALERLATELLTVLERRQRARQEDARGGE